MKKYAFYILGAIVIIVLIIAVFKVTAKKVSESPFETQAVETASVETQPEIVVHNEGEDKVNIDDLDVSVDKPVYETIGTYEDKDWDSESVEDSKSVPDIKEILGVSSNEDLIDSGDERKGTSYSHVVGGDMSNTTDNGYESNNVPEGIYDKSEVYGEDSDYSKGQRSISDSSTNDNSYNIIESGADYIVVVGDDGSVIVKSYEGNVYGITDEEFNSLSEADAQIINDVLGTWVNTDADEAVIEYLVTHNMNVSEELREHIVKGITSKEKRDNLINFDSAYDDYLNRVNEDLKLQEELGLR